MVDHWQCTYICTSERLQCQLFSYPIEPTLVLFASLVMDSICRTSCQLAPDSANQWPNWDRCTLVEPLDGSSAMVTGLIVSQSRHK